jgi:SsrA-binding protein
VSILLIQDNKKARFDYEILEVFEAGIVLMGSEVKALREKNIQL